MSREFHTLPLEWHTVPTGLAAGLVDAAEDGTCKPFDETICLPFPVTYTQGSLKSCPSYMLPLETFGSQSWLRDTRALAILR